MGGGQPSGDGEALLRLYGGAAVEDDEKEVHLPYEYMEAYVDGRLGVEESAAVEGHILWCAPCAAELADLMKFCTYLATQPDTGTEYTPSCTRDEATKREVRPASPTDKKVFRHRFFGAIALPRRYPTLGMLAL